MKKYSILYALVLAMLAACHQDKEFADTYYSCNFNFTDTSHLHPKRVDFQTVLNDKTGAGVPGILMCVNDVNGTWCGVSGMADIGNNISMQPCNITRVGSTVKTFTATTILLLYEDGLLSLDDKISKYLDKSTLDKIENADQATIRQCLQHSSGIFNYIQNLQFQTASFNDLIKEWKPDELLHYARNKKAYFSPGEDVRYSNTNYIFLGMIIEKVTGKPFYQVFQERIFTPLQMTMTQFAAINHVPDGIVRGYVDIYSNLNVINSTYYSGWDYYTADGGLISNPHDLTIFLKALFEGNLLSASTMTEMLSWQSPKDMDPDYYPISYGLGIFKLETPYGVAYHHSGDAIGYYANMLYFPATQTTVVYASNGNYGKIDELISSEDAINEILGAVF